LELCNSGRAQKTRATPYQKVKMFGDICTHLVGGVGASMSSSDATVSSTVFFEGDFLRASTEKNTQQFQALNGLKCSTVGNLGS